MAKENRPIALTPVCNDPVPMAVSGGSFNVCTVTWSIREADEIADALDAIRDEPATNVAHRAAALEYMRRLAESDE